MSRDNGVVPAEWAPHEAMWIGFPSQAEAWGQHLQQAQEETVALVRALVDHGTEHVRLVVGHEQARSRAAEMLDTVRDVEIVSFAAGDAWLRDTGPIFLSNGEAAGFAFNGWGGQFEHHGDVEISRLVANAAGRPLVSHPFVLEGGMLDHDGEGTALATRQCLLNPNRGRHWSEAEAESALRHSLGVRRLLWVDQGLENDHTHGHIDNVARFCGPALVLVSIADPAQDPNAPLYDRIAGDLDGKVDAMGRPLRVIRILSAGAVVDEQERLLPASHLNFVIANSAVLVPVYKSGPGERALRQLAAVIPKRRVIGLPACALVREGGSFHCISQQQPKL